MAKEEKVSTVDDIALNSKRDNHADSVVSKFFKWVKRGLGLQKVYFEGKFISERKYLSILTKRYLKMLRKVKPGEEYPTWE